MCKTRFKAQDGTIADIAIDDGGQVISVSIGGVVKGSILLSMRDEPYHFHITNLSLDACKRKGIGRACLAFHKETFAAPITAASPFNTNRLDDGSHLTGDGLPFIAKMRAEGLVCRHPDEHDQG